MNGIVAGVQYDPSSSKNGGCIALAMQKARQSNQERGKREYTRKDDEEEGINIEWSRRESYSIFEIANPGSVRTCPSCLSAEVERSAGLKGMPTRNAFASRRRSRGKFRERRYGGGKEVSSS